MDLRFHRVTRVPGSAAFRVAGETIPAIAYANYLQQPQYFRQFAEAGYRLFCLMCALGDRGVNSDSQIGPFRPGIWTGPSEYDFSQVDADLGAIVDACPEGYVILRVYLDVPSWWDAAYPDELNRLADGSPLRQSFASQVWREQAGDALATLIHHLGTGEHAERIAGIMVAAGLTEEWMYHGWTSERFPDYSEPMRRAFARWIRARGYESTLPMPSPEERRGDPSLLLRDPQREAVVAEYYRCHSHQVVEAIMHFCRVVKESSQGRLLAGAFYGYVFELPSVDAGHHAVMPLLESDVCDFLASPNSYGQGRRSGIDWPYFSATDSVKLHGKLWFSECDTRTDLTRPLKAVRPEIVPPGLYEGGVWKGPDDRKTSLDNLKANLARALATRSGVWWFDMWGGWYDAPELMRFMEEARQVYARTMARPGESVAEVAVFVDEESPAFTSHAALLPQALLYEQRQGLAEMGAPYDVYYLADLVEGRISAETMARYRLLIFLNAFALNARARAALRSLQSQGRTLVWLVAPGMAATPGEEQVAETARLTGIRIVHAIGDSPAPLQVVPRPEMAKHPLLREVPAHGWGIEKVHYRDAYVVQDDEVLSLGTLAGRTGDPCGFAIRQFPDWLAVYSAAPRLPWQLLRNLCRQAGVHLYTSGGEPLYVASGVLGLNVRGEGSRALRLPRAGALRDALTGRRISPYGIEHVLDLPVGMHLWEVEC